VTTPIAEVVGLERSNHDNRCALVVIVVGLVIATFVGGTVGMIVAAAESTRGGAEDSAETGEAQVMVSS
jgi:hypothetical protein